MPLGYKINLSPYAICIRGWKHKLSLNLIIFIFVYNLSEGFEYHNNLEPIINNHIFLLLICISRSLYSAFIQCTINNNKKKSKLVFILKILH